ncbi:MAG: hypothetical protein AAF317_21425 [Pseudomonadota bacterium]
MTDKEKTGDTQPRVLEEETLSDVQGGFGGSYSGSLGSVKANDSAGKPRSGSKEKSKSGIYIGPTGDFG